MFLAEGWEGFFLRVFGRGAKLVGWGKLVRWGENCNIESITQ